MYDKILRWYNQGLWTAAMVETSVQKGIITAEQAAEIINSKET